MKRDWELLVVGGGPGGSTLAALAAGAGLRVALAERSRFPRDKVCGEFVSAEGCAVLERLGLLDSLIRLGGRRIDGCRVTDPTGHRLWARLPRLADGRSAALGVSRSLLDSTLLQHAARRGATILERREAVDLELVESRVGGVRLRAVGSGRPGTVHSATVTVAADGRRSLFARRMHPQLGDPQRSDADSWFGLKVHLAPDSGRIGRTVELHLFDGGYAGLGRVEGDRINLCLMVRAGVLRACGGSPDRLLSERLLANPGLRDAIGDAVVGDRWHAIGPLRWGVRRPAAGGVLFVGDAAGTVDPFAGEGISHALRAAELALPRVVEAAHRGALDPELERAYSADWRSSFAPVTRRVRPVGWLLEHRRLATPLLGWLGSAGRGLVPRLVAATRTGISRAERSAGTTRTRP